MPPKQGARRKPGETRANAGKLGQANISLKHAGAEMYVYYAEKKHTIGTVNKCESCIRLAPSYYDAAVEHLVKKEPDWGVRRADTLLNSPTPRTATITLTHRDTSTAHRHPATYQSPNR